MSPEALLNRARQAWTGLAGAAIDFPEQGVEVRASPGSLICPPGWAGVVALGGTAIVTVPRESLVHVVREALAGLTVAAATDAERLRAALPVKDVLGPASLAYLDEDGFRPAAGLETVEDLSPEHADLAALLSSAGAADAEESGLGEITSRVFAVRNAAGLVAAAGYRRWPGSVAHLSVLTAPSHRNQGWAGGVASAAVADALHSRLLPQWRARPEASRRVAQNLGFSTLGSQISIQIEA